MLASTRFALLACLLVLTACEAGTGDPVPVDGGDAGRPDAGPGPDAGPRPAEDAGTPDAGPPACGCPTLPDRCSAPDADRPAFGPSGDDELFVRQLASFVRCADSSLQMALYDTTNECVVDMLLAKLEADPGVTMEIVIDDAMCPRGAAGLACPLSRLDTHERVTIVDDDRSNLMHHKFIIADGRRVWVSSANMTTESICQDYNNSIIVDEPAIVGGFAAEFTRMFVDREFGPVPPAEEPVRGGPYALYFSPESPLSDPSGWFLDMVAAIDAATTSVEFMIFAYTRFQISEALVAAHARGVQVRGVVSPRFSGERAIEMLTDAGIEVRIGPVHSKVMIIDSVVITGSANWSENAWSNNENSLWIDDGGIAREYRDELDRIFTLAGP